MAEDVTISEAIRHLRGELEKAQNEASGVGLRFRAKNVEVELSMVFKTEAEVGVGVKAWFLDLSGKTKGGEETGHKIKLTLEPVMVLAAGTVQAAPLVTRDVVVSSSDRERDQ